MLGTNGSVIATQTISVSATVHRFSFAAFYRPYLPSSALLPYSGGFLTRRVTIYGAANTWLHFREMLLVDASGHNAALLKPTLSSSDYYGIGGYLYYKERGNDGDPGNFDSGAGNMFHSNQATTAGSTYWSVDLQGNFDIVKIILISYWYGADGGGIGNRLAGSWIEMQNEQGLLIGSYSIAVGQPFIVIDVARPSATGTTTASRTATASQTLKRSPLPPLQPSLFRPARGLQLALHC